MHIIDSHFHWWPRSIFDKLCKRKDFPKARVNERGGYDYMRRQDSGAVRGGTLPEPLYRLAVKTFGQHGTNELIYLVGLYALVSTTLNGFNVPAPERE